MLRLISFVVPLGFDTLALAIALGLRGIAPWRAALVFTLFETTMPIAGIALGRFAGDRFTVAAQIVGALVLLALGVHGIRESREDDDETAGLSFDSLRAALLAGVAISTDELAIGFPLGAARLPVGALLVAIGIQTLVVTFAGIALGGRIGSLLGRRASRLATALAGVVFIALAVMLFVEALRH